MARISDFKAQMSNGGTRSNQFMVRIAPPSGVSIGRELSIMCSAASLPAVTQDPVAVTYRGRPVNFAGERTFSPWTITVINDMKGTPGDLRNLFETWSGLTNAFDGSNGNTVVTAYQAQMSVFQLDRNENVLKEYTFYDAFPTDVGQISLSYDNPNIETFDVTFTYNYFVPTMVSTLLVTSQN